MNQTMNLSWRERLTIEPRWQDFSNWPLVYTDAFSRQDKAAYQRNVAIIAAALEGESLRDIAERHGLSAGRITQLMNRCLGGPADADPALSRGLIRSRHVGVPRRRAQFPTHATQGGARCSFSALLEALPDLEQHLLKAIRLSVNRNPRGQNLRAKTLHAMFLAQLELLNWPRDTYPYTSVSRGYESVRRFLKATIAELSLPKAPPREILSRKSPSRVFAEIQIDEHTLDCNGALAVELQGQMTPVRLSRITVIVARDVATGCYLGHTIALTNNASADHILELFEAMTRPWTPMPLTTPQLSYAAQAPFPAALGEAYLRPAFGIIRLDNALAHLAHNVRCMVTETMLATVNYGLPRIPKGRNVIEQAFARLNFDIHRFPSTTGSHTQDPVRETRKNLKSAPYVSLRVLEEVISVLLAEFNVRGLANQGGTTPLEQVQYQMNHHLIPLRAPQQGPALSPFESVLTVTVRRPRGCSAQRINFQKASYRGPGLSSSVLANQKVLIRYDRRDIRTLYVQTLDGLYLGEVHAPRTWQRYPHTLATRQKINKLIREGFITRRDPLRGYFEHSAAKLDLPEHALTVVRLYREYGLDHGANQPEAPPAPPVPHQTQIDPDVEKRCKELPDWNADVVRRRR